jgi:hypothetical protein
MPDAAVRKPPRCSIARGNRHRRSPEGEPSHASSAPSALAGRLSNSGSDSGRPKRAASRSIGEPDSSGVISAQ